jgi:sarcosine oxidase subunit beta
LWPDQVRGSEDELDKLSGGLAVEQTESGNVLIGSTREFVGYDKGVTIEGITAMIRRSTRIIPRLRQLFAIRAFAGLRPYTPDGLPIMDMVNNLESFVIAAGHEGDGIALSPITGKTVAEMITEGKVDPSLNSFSLGRFEKDHTQTTGEANPR